MDGWEENDDQDGKCSNLIIAWLKTQNFFMLNFRKEHWKMAEKREFLFFNNEHHKNKKEPS